MSKTLIVAAVGGSIMEGVAAGGEVMADNTLLNDVGDIIHIINIDITLVLWIHPVEFFKGVDGYGIVAGILASETTVSIFNKDAAMDVHLTDSLVDGIGLGSGRFVQYNDLGMVDALDAELETEHLGKRIAFIQHAKNGDVDMVELGKIEALERLDAEERAVFCHLKYTWHTVCVLRFIGSNRNNQ